MSRLFALSSLTRCKLVYGQGSCLAKSRVFIKKGINTFGHPYKYEKMEPGWRKRDKIPDNFELVYKGTIESYLKFTMGILIVGSAGGAFLWIRKLIVGDDFKVPVVIGQKETVIMFEGTVKENLFIMLVGFAMAFYTYVLIVRTAMRIYNYKDRYIAIFVNSKVPWKLQTLHFGRDQVEYSQQGKYFAMMHSSFKFKNKNVLLIEEYFRTPRDLRKLMSQVDQDDDQDE